MAGFRNPISWAATSVVGVLLVMVWIARPQVSPKKPETAPRAPASDRNLAGPPGFVAITGFTPEGLAIDSSRVPDQILDVTYQLQDPTRVTSAKLFLWAPDAGDLGQMDVPVQPTASVRLLVIPGEHSWVGPEVRFRAVCPEGTSDWYTLGQIPPDEPPSKDSVRIDHLSPESIGWHLGDPIGQQHKAYNVIVNGSGFSAACTIESEVNRSRIQLQEIKYDRKTLQGVLLASDLGTDRVTPRYAELKLVVYGPNDFIRTNTVKVPFAEGR